MQDIMLSETPADQRGQILRDSCDTIEERYYTRKFEQHETNEHREELAGVSIQLSELANEMTDIRADFKAKMKPLEERRTKILDELKSGGEYVRGDVYKFVDTDEGKAAWYSAEGYKLEERDLRPDEKQRSIFQLQRKPGVGERTGTDN